MMFCVARISKLSTSTIPRWIRSNEVVRINAKALSSVAKEKGTKSSFKGSSPEKKKRQAATGESNKATVEMLQKFIETAENAHK